MVPSFEIANDDHSIYVTDEALNAALRYFAEHGLAAANEARCNAEHAAVDGDDTAYAWWRDICHALDRRMARQLEYRHASAGPCRPVQAQRTGPAKPCRPSAASQATAPWLDAY